MYLVSALPLGIASGTGALVVGRWLHDRLKDNHYGELVRAGDPGEVRAQLPYQVVAFASFAMALTALMMFLVGQELDRTITAILYATVACFASYTVLSWISLALITAKHTRNAATVQGIREAAERRARARQKR